jgi:hypothetical protein
LVTSDTLKTAIHLFDQQLRLLIKEKKADNYVLASVLSTLIHLDPFQAMGSGELGFLWITDILNSECQEDRRVGLVSGVVKLLGKYFFHKNPVYLVEPAWIPPLLRFLSLDGGSGATEPAHLIALRILTVSRGSADFGKMILPILTSQLVPTHPLQARRLALNIFERFASGWFSSQMENVPSKDLEGLVQTVGDPFQFPGPSFQHGGPFDPSKYNPTIATAVLIELASSDLWRDYLRPSNFASFEEIASTLDGKRTALRDMSLITLYRCPEFFRTAAKIVMAIKRLEELRCLNTAEVVIMWAWTFGAVNPADHDSWQLIGRDTLRFYQTYGMERMIALKQHVTSAIEVPLHRGFQSGAGDSDKLRVLKLLPKTVYGDSVYQILSQACHSRRLYQLFGYDPTTWKEAVGVEEVDEKTNALSGCSEALLSFMDWACDYP